MRFTSILLLLCSGWVSAKPLDRVVAVVNEQVITQTELDAQTEMLRQQMSAQHMAVPTEKILQKQVLQHLIEDDLQLQLAKNNDITVDNVELDGTIETIAQNNNLTVTQLREALAQQGMSFETYREKIRKEMIISRLQQKSVGKDVVISTQQIEDYLKTSEHSQQEQQQYHVQNIVIPLPDAPTPAQVKQAYLKAQAVLAKAKKGENFSRLAMIESSDSYALEGGDLGERHLAELPQLYADHLSTMRAGEVSEPIRTGNGLHLIKLVALKEQHHEVVKTHVRHILLKPAVNMTAQDAERQINNLYEQLKSGKDFATMAKNYSLDAASAVKGGDLGWVAEEDVVPAFAKAMQALPLHTVSRPVKSGFGWHLIEVLERKTVDDSYAYQRQHIRQYLEQRKLSEAVQNWKQHIRSDAYVKVLDKKLA